MYLKEAREKARRMLAWDVSNGVSIESNKECQYKKKIRRKKIFIPNDGVFF